MYEIMIILIWNCLVWVIIMRRIKEECLYRISMWLQTGLVIKLIMTGIKRIKIRMIKMIDMRTIGLSLCIIRCIIKSSSAIEISAQIASTVLMCTTQKRNCYLIRCSMIYSEKSERCFIRNFPNKNKNNEQSHEKMKQYNNKPIPGKNMASRVV